MNSVHSGTIADLEYRVDSVAACDTAHMPTVLVVEGYRFFFFSNEGFEPPHIHVEKGDSHAQMVAGTASAACLFGRILALPAPQNARACGRTRGRVYRGMA